MRSGGTIAVRADGSYNSAASSGVAKILGDGMLAAFGDSFHPGSEGFMAKLGLEVIASAISEASSVPIGTTIGVRTDISGVPALDDTWWPFDGTEITDPESPLLGVTLEDWNGQGRFLRAGDLAGVEEAESVKAHVHVIDHGHADTFAISVAGFAGSPSGSHVVGLGDSSLIGFAIAETITGAVSNFAGNSGSTGGSETRPINGSIVLYMKIK